MKVLAREAERMTTNLKTLLVQSGGHAKAEGENLRLYGPKLSHHPQVFKFMGSVVRRDMHADSDIW